MKQASVVAVDDDSFQLAYYTRLLERSDFLVSVTATAESAIDMIDNIQPSVIVLDMLLKGQNGVALLHELRSHDDLSMIPVIAVTNLAPNLSLSHLKHYGVIELLDKATMKPQDLVGAIKQATAR